VIYEYRSKRKAWGALVVVAFVIYLCMMAQGQQRVTEYMVVSILIGVVLCMVFLHEAFKIRHVHTDGEALTVVRRYQNDLVYPWPNLIAMYRQQKGRTVSQIFLRRSDQTEWEMFALELRKLPEYEALIKEIKAHIGERWEDDPNYDERRAFR
jgi:hypothetical protein